MDKEPLILLTGIGIVGYAVFHGHLLNESCWLCPYRGGIFFGSSLLLGGYLAWAEEIKEVKDKVEDWWEGEEETNK